MIKAGLIGAGIGFIYVMSLFFLSPLCTLCFTPLLGIGVGYLAGWFDKPLREEASLIKGTIAGGITGLGVIVGQVLAAIVSGILLTNLEQWPTIMAQLSAPLVELNMPELAITTTSQYWQLMLMGSALCGVVNWALIVGLGAIGSMIWFQRHHKNSLFTARI